MKALALTVVCMLALAALPAFAGDLKVGDQAPDFSLQGTDGKLHKLSDYRGKQAVVLAWFPKAFTSGCTIECKSLSENGGLIKKYDVTYFMASVDEIEGDQGNKAFAAAHNADFPLLSDPTKKTAEAYGVLTSRGFANRWTFYIGKDGTIQYIDKDVQNRLETSAQDMAAKLGELKTPAKK
ncbi:MAG: peroxiredoxin family protein [Acidobacteriaceae bacterium]|jgi:peroxiredoxin Q/BCP|nr:peroxiredoxin family protein [Acidobacteriaceae bacterium]